MKKLHKENFEQIKREKLLDYDVYEYNFEDAALETFAIVERSLNQPAAKLESLPPANLMGATRQRAWEALNHLMNCYSAGHTATELHTFFPIALTYWEQYAHYSLLYKNSDDGKLVTAGHIPLSGTTYICGLQLVCFGILLGWGNLLDRIVPILDFRNPRDGLLDRLLAAQGLERGTPSLECLRHLPYTKTLAIFSAQPEDRVGMLAEYLENWYDASRREEYYDSHKRGDSFHGYWSLEAGAIAIVLGIDDASFRTAQFYPSDLVDFARDATR